MVTNSKKVDSGLVWVVEDDLSLRSLLCDELRDNDFDVELMSTAEEVLSAIETGIPDLIVCDLRLPGASGLDLLKSIVSRDLSICPGFLIITAFGTIPKAVEALKAGADDFLAKPLDLEHFILTATRIIESHRMKQKLKQMQKMLMTGTFHGIHAQSRVMHEIFSQIKQIAPAQGPVLILGETGTGKELVAHALHKESFCKNGPFVPVNCAGIPESLLESELFGHIQGSFTGATRSRTGLFAEANGGTLFLDEISELPLVLQAKLLRALQDGKVRQVGSNSEYKFNVRIVAATHRDLLHEVQQSHFRQDLYYRLETFTINIPPLRLRADDVEFLAYKFLNQFSLAYDKNITAFSKDALELILTYPFPGNVRELRNVIESAVAFCDGTILEVYNLPKKMQKASCKPKKGSSSSLLPYEAADSILPLSEIEKQYILNVLEKLEGNKRLAASMLGIGRRTLYRKLGNDEND